MAQEVPDFASAVNATASLILKAKSAQAEIAQIEARQALESQILDAKIQQLQAIRELNQAALALYAAFHPNSTSPDSEGSSLTKPR